MSDSPRTITSNITTLTGSSAIPGLTVEPIGFIRSARGMKFDAPHQPDAKDPERSVIELVPGKGFERALSDLAGFERIWLLWWFHRNATWRPMVLPPRGHSKRRGVFATRSPHRPNPIGLTAVTLHAVSGLQLVVGSNDLIDGTPILDIKPYLPEVDAFAESSIGWLGEIAAQAEKPAHYQVQLREPAATQLRWLAEKWQIDFLTRATQILERDPTPHRTRRITRKGQGLFRMGCGAWRLYFSVEDRTVLVQAITPGYPPRLLEALDAADVPHRDAQREFSARWGNPSQVSMENLPKS